MPEASITSAFSGLLLPRKIASSVFYQTEISTDALKILKCNPGPGPPSPYADGMRFSGGGSHVPLATEGNRKAALASNFFGRRVTTTKFTSPTCPDFPEIFTAAVAKPAVPKANTPVPRLRHFQMQDIEVFKMKKTLGTGGFGCVFKGSIISGADAGTEVVVKSLNNEERTWMQGDVELYVNEKLMENSRGRIAKFMGHHKSYGKFWLVWELEGEYTLDHYFGDSEWLRKLEARLLGGAASDALSEPKRKNRLCKEIMRQIIKGLRTIHKHHIVHRDLKPSNVLIANDGTLRLIDFGCAVDLSTEIGYIPKEAPGTREYLPPEWRVNLDAPTAFDMYAAGMIMLQIVFPHMRSTSALDTFRAEMRAVENDLDKWLQRKMGASTSDSKLMEGLAVLNEDGACGWQFLRGLLNPVPTRRTSAAEALVHSYLRVSHSLPNNVLENLSPELLQSIVSEEPQKQPVHGMEHRPTIFTNGIELPVESFPHKVHHVQEWPEEFPGRVRSRPWSAQAPGVAARRPRLGEHAPHAPRSPVAPPQRRTAANVRARPAVAARRAAQAAWNGRPQGMRAPARQRSMARAAAAREESPRRAVVDAWWRYRDHPASSPPSQ